MAENHIAVTVRTPSKLAAKDRKWIAYDICNWTENLEADEEVKSKILLNFYEADATEPYATDLIQA